jgi:hypothetical protein
MKQVQLIFGSFALSMTAMSVDLIAKKGMG